MLDGPTKVNNYSYNKTNGFKFDNKGKCFVVVNTSALLKASSNQPSLVANTNAIKPRFSAVDPTSYNSFVTW
jgi:hypothetical protein